MTPVEKLQPPAPPLEQARPPAAQPGGHLIASSGYDAVVRLWDS